MATQPQFTKLVPDGDNLERDVCEDCGFINYVNPKIVVGAVVRHGDKILLCKRAIEPRRGFWTLPAGYMELNETPEDGARREAREEAEAELEISELLAVYTVKRISQVQLMYRATLKGGAFGIGEESEEVALFDWNDIPWSEIAFPTVLFALDHDRRVHQGLGKGPFKNPVDWL